MRLKTPAYVAMAILALVGLVAAAPKVFNTGLGVWGTLGLVAIVVVFWVATIYKAVDRFKVRKQVEDHLRSELKQGVSHEDVDGVGARHESGRSGVHLR